jgi:hypothetical protein
MDRLDATALAETASAAVGTSTPMAMAMAMARFRMEASISAVDANRDRRCERIGLVARHSLGRVGVARLACEWGAR